MDIQNRTESFEDLEELNALDSEVCEIKDIFNSSSRISFITCNFLYDVHEKVVYV